MKIHYATLETCHIATGVVVAIDVVRAFTTAAFGLNAGAERILLVGTVEEALRLKARFPGALAMGEVGGAPVEVFDLWNSPLQFDGMNLNGETLVQRTSAGTQGVVRATGAEYLFGASFVVAKATVHAIQQLAPADVTFVLTGVPAGVQPGTVHDGSEDLACADYLSALLRGETPDPEPYMAWRYTFREHRLNEAPIDIADQFERDLERCTQVDRFPFAMRVERDDGLLEMRPVLVTPKGNAS